MLKKLLITSVAVFFSALTAFGQATLSGTVTDAQTGETLPGTNVIIEELQSGSSTNTEGIYTITGIDPGTYTISVSFIGYKRYTRQLEINSGTNTLNIELQPDVLGLEEVVVTGTGTVSRANLTSSISKISNEDIEDVSISSTDALLQGKAAGVTVTRSSGTPGSGVRVRIRGNSSISAGNEPLYVVDGIPVTTGDFGSIFSGGQGLNALATLNPEDIESIEVLKDASATAIYGARASNGVVLITTKEGESGPTQIDATYAFGTKSFNRQLDFTDGPRHVENIVEGTWLDYERFGLEGNLSGNYENTTYDDRLSDVRFLSPFILGENFDDFVSGNISPYLDDPSSAPTTDWTDAVFENGSTNRFNISASGGNQDTKFYTSATYFREQSIMINNEFERMNARLNIDHNVNDDLNFSGRISYNRTNDSRIENDNNIYGVLTNAQLATPTAPIRNDDGSFNSSVGGFSNPVAESEVVNQAVTTRFLANFSGNYEVLDNLVIQGRAGIDRFDLDENTYNQSFTNQGSPNGNAFNALTINQRWFTEIGATYSNNFNNVHNFDAVALVSWEENDVDDQQATGDIFPSDQTRTISSAAVTTGSSFGSSFGLRSFTGRVNYTYDNRYLATLNARVDESSRFGADERVGFFPSGSAGWRISNESFMQDVDFINELKLRVSAGITGNQSGIGNFASLALFGISAFNEQPTLAPTQLANPNLKWEETKEITLGLDAAFLSERISVSIDVYQKNTDDLLLNAPIPATTGFTTFIDNVGSIENKGLEISIETVNLRQGDFQWTSTLNWSTYANEVTKLVNDEPFNSGFANRVQVGQPLGAFYGFPTDGIWNTQEEIDNSGIDPSDADLGGIRYVDSNGDGVITADDQTIIGDANPDFTGGFSNTFTYKGFKLDAFIQFSYGNDVYNNSAAFYGNAGFVTEWGVQSDYGNNRWTPTNTDAKYPRASFLDLDNSLSRDNDFFLDDGSYVRLKNLRVSYSFNSAQLQEFGLRSLRLFATGTNLITITGYDGLDPEVNVFDRNNTAFGTDFFTFPQHRSFEFGVNLGL